MTSIVLLGSQIEQQEDIQVERDDGDEMDEGEEGQEPYEKGLPRLEAYRNLIHTTPTYSWLISGIWNECVLYLPGRESSMDIRNTNLESLPASRRVSRQSPTETFNAKFRLHWDPIYHLSKEDYGNNIRVSIERALTSTGSGSELQAESCGTYMRRTWPSTGESMLQHLKKLVSTEHTGTGMQSVSHHPCCH